MDKVKAVTHNDERQLVSQFSLLQEVLHSLRAVAVGLAAYSLHLTNTQHNSLILSWNDSLWNLQHFLVTKYVIPKNWMYKISFLDAVHHKYLYSRLDKHSSFVLTTHLFNLSCFACCLYVLEMHFWLLREVDNGTKEVEEAFK